MKRIAICFVVAASWASVAFAAGDGNVGAYVERQFATTGWHRCAIVDPHANKIIEVKQGRGDTIVRVIAYRDFGVGDVQYEAPVWRFARRMNEHMSGTTLRERCVLS